MGNPPGFGVEQPAVNKIHVVIGITMIVAIAAVAAVLQSQSARHVVRAGFWFDDVTFDLPLSPEDLGGPITEPEQKTIESIARAELSRAYSGLRITFVDTPDVDVRYSIRVIQRGLLRTGLHTFSVAESHSMGVFGGLGEIDFEVLSSYAVGNAPPGTDRTMMIDRIGRGLGRTAAHEFAHLLLSGVSIHASQDIASYEYAKADRVAQFSGPIHWDFARPFLLKRLGAQE